MKKAVCIIVAFILCAALIPSGYADTVSFSDDPKAIQAASNSVVMLSCYDKDGNLFATGSAFAAFEEGAFVTNFHVIEGAYSIRAQMESDLEFKMSSVIAYDVEKDIAILHTDAKTGLGPLSLGDSSAMERAEKVIAIGSPLGLINTISIGLYSGTIRDERVYLQFSAPISEGSSGGALFNNRGEVVGITSASFTRGQNLNLAIPIEEAKELYEKTGTTTQMSLEEFYNSFDHTPPIPTYSLKYVYDHREDLMECTFFVDGYVSSRAPNTAGRVYLTSEIWVTGSLDEDYHRVVEEGWSIFPIISLRPLSSDSQLEEEIKSGDRVVALCCGGVFNPEKRQFGHYYYPYYDFYYVSVEHTQ